MKRKSLAVLLAAILLLGLLPAEALADTQGLGWRFVQYDDAGNPFMDPTSDLMTDISLAPGISHHMGFFLNGTQRTPSDVRTADASVASVQKITEGGGQYYCVEALNFGVTSLQVTIDNQTYELPISVTLPSSGFASGDTLTEETYLSAFTFDEYSRSFYCITDLELAETPQIALTLDGAETSLVTWEKVGNRVLQLTIASGAAFQSAWLFLEIRHQNGLTEGYGMPLNNGTARLVFCPVDRNNADSYSVPEDGLWAIDLSFTPGLSLTGVFGSMRNGSITPLAPHSAGVTSDTIASVTLTGDLAWNGGTYPVYTLDALHVGDTALQVDDYTAALSVALPACGFYTSRTPSEETYLSLCNYYDSSTIWLLTDGGFTEAQQAAVSIEAEHREVGQTWVQRADGTCDLKITLPKPTEAQDGYLLVAMEYGVQIGYIWVNAQLENKPAYFTLGSKTYGVGFTYERDGVTWIMEDTMHLGYTSSAPRGEQRTAWDKLPVEAGLQILDENLGVYYDVDKAGPISIQVNSLRIEPVFGEADTFSWSAAEDVKTTTDPDAVLYIYEGADATARIWANVTCTVGGETCTRDVSCIVEVICKAEQVVYWPSVKDTAELNEKLRTLAAEVPENSITQLYLGFDEEGREAAPMRLAGTVEIPAAFQGERQLILHGGSVTIQGGLNLNGAKVISIDGMDFAGDKAEGSRAIYGGTCGFIENCAFTGYDVALASNQDGNLNPIGCTFVGNNVAASVDVKEVQWDMSLNTWDGNLFQNNEIAVEIRSFNEFLSPYQFRITNSDFIDNDLDFSVSCPATLYFYQNFYGTATGNVEEAKHTPPTVQCDHSITKVVTNPRWKQPVLKWQNSVRPLALLAALAATNYLTADWDLPTEIVNEEADGLTLDAAAFREAGEKTIDVVNQKGEYLGTWTFSGASTVEEGVFYAGLALEAGENSLLVSVMQSEMLAAQPALSIPCGYAYAEVTFEGKSVAAVLQDGKITFPVTDAGTYTITEAASPGEDPTTPEIPPRPSRPSAAGGTEPSEKPEAFAYSDVAETAWYAEAVQYVAETGLMRGTGAGCFSPEAPVTRAMMMTILARMAGVNTDGGKTWYEKALAWAVEAGISDGSNPAEAITREQLAAMLYRRAGSPAVEAELTGFADAEAVSAWAEDAAVWAVQSGLINGIGGNFVPQGTATRAQVAAMLWRMAET